MIDITKPLELSDGTPVTLRKSQSDYIDVYWREGSRTFNTDGSMFIRDETNNFPKLNGRTLRNVKESEMRTSEECLQRMEALLRRMATVGNPNEQVYENELAADWEAEARAIVAELDKQSYAQYEETARLVWNDDTSLAIVPYGAKCIAKGRELERLDQEQHRLDSFNDRPGFEPNRTYDAAGKPCHD